MRFSVNQTLYDALIVGSAMKLADYIEAIELYKRKLPSLFAPLVCGFVVFLIYLPFAIYFTPIAFDRFGDQIGSMLVGLPLLLIVTTPISVFIYLGCRLVSTHGIPCEHCSEPLFRHHDSVVAIGKCPNCGKQVIGCEKGLVEDVAE